MNLKKNLGRVATAFLATAMLASLTAVPASANAGVDGGALEGNDSSVIGGNGTVADVENGTGLTELKFNKVLLLPKDVNGTDAYKITGISMVKANDPADGSDIYTPKTTTVGEGPDQVEQFVKADGNIYNFYQLEGGDPDDPEGDKDPEDEEDEEGNPDPDNPDPDDEDDPKPADNNAYIVKTVEGSMGNYNDDFEFSVSANPLVTGKTYNAYYEVYNEKTQTWEQDATQGRTDAITISATATTITLSHNERLRIAGLSNTETYVANEKDYAATGYTTKIDTDNDGDAEVTTASGAEGNKVYASGNVTFTKGDENNHDKNVVAFTNTRNAVSPTGIAMNVAPYALLVVVAAGACFVFLRKRREDD